MCHCWDAIVRPRPMLTGYFVVAMCACVPGLTWLPLSIELRTDYNAPRCFGIDVLGDRCTGLPNASGTYRGGHGRLHCQVHIIATLY